ncbi:MAG: flagellar motor protein [Pseudomonadales bacterium]|jgi:chemotaxis protein MotA|uniref:flagellar motor protein n=1 Tax=unclassified Ketobacter TaxID=2639109 RepID=UPI000C948C53|nr:MULTISPECIES: flagellar motor protein [unclassified Ketobacter]MAA60394.1 flagellar motor protein [Pseudomonadales bacterium]MEC8812975.1 flagellar motor protein [Pseudomonadota bacterium]TNC88572.1 MAG: flagellar motor protein [Alcanivorax sp.]HAG95574.1 flagellar motor protein [Gammaproteobacteria bacterium]MAQ27641.1 flagellar motor protein [Pseudomonadales bacterium]|tara:strand:- start:32295 stop:33038 length:744 start_codon:yes stop_codon:yes gene_type:complete
MDILSFLGLLIGMIAIVGGNAMEGGHLSGLANGPAAVIVIGGTLGAAMLQTPMSIFKHSFTVSRWVFFPPVVDMKEKIDRVIQWSLTARKEGLLGLEAITENEADSFSRKGLQLLVDGGEPESIRNILEVELVTQEDKDLQAAKVFEAMGGYSPTIGIIGAVMGLIHVMGNLADPSKLGAGIATAFVATIYGVGVANLVFLPIAAKLKSTIKAQSSQREMIIEGLIAIADGENPRTIEMKLEGYLDK